MTYNETLTIIGLLLSPLYALIIWQSKRLLNTEKCVIKVKTALRMKFKDLEEILK